MRVNGPLNRRVLMRGRMRAWTSARRRRRLWVGAAILAPASSSPAAAQPRQAAPSGELAAILQRRPSLRDGIGRAHEAVTTSDRAQTYYDQGLAYLHSFFWIEAARSFNEAIRLDDRLAMAYVGLSYALGELGESEAARQASQRAQALASSVSEREPFRIELRASQLASAARPQTSRSSAHTESSSISRRRDTRRTWNCFCSSDMHRSRRMRHMAWAPAAPRSVSTSRRSRWPRTISRRIIT
jgi:tetratricopeptide (TPR) repeat protein